MNDKQSTPDENRAEAEQDALQEDIVDEQLEEAGLLPLPKAEPAEGPAPAS